MFSQQTTSHTIVFPLYRAVNNEEKWATEIRKLSVLFVNVGLKEADLVRISINNEIKEVQDILERVQKAVYLYEGSLNKFLMDDKGSTLVAVFGLPPLQHEDDAVRCILSGLTIVTELTKIGLRPAIGVSTGPAFCGVSGARSRREYAVLGDTVNLAARLMQKAHEFKLPLLCCGATYALAHRQLKFELWTKMTVKGRNIPVEMYRPKEDKNSRLLSRLYLFGQSNPSSLPSPRNSLPFSPLSPLSQHSPLPTRTEGIRPVSTTNVPSLTMDCSHESTPSTPKDTDSTTRGSRLCAPVLIKRETEDHDGIHGRSSATSPSPTGSPNKARISAIDLIQSTQPATFRPQIELLECGECPPQLMTVRPLPLIRQIVIRRTNLEHHRLEIHQDDPLVINISKPSSKKSGAYTPVSRTSAPTPTDQVTTPGNYTNGSPLKQSERAQERNVSVTSRSTDNRISDASSASSSEEQASTIPANTSVKRILRIAMMHFGLAEEEKNEGPGNTVNNNNNSSSSSNGGNDNDRRDSRASKPSLGSSDTPTQSNQDENIDVVIDHRDVTMPWILAVEAPGLNIPMPYGTRYPYMHEPIALDPKSTVISLAPYQRMQNATKCVAKDVFTDSAEFASLMDGGVLNLVLMIQNHKLSDRGFLTSYRDRMLSICNEVTAYALTRVPTGPPTDQFRMMARTISTPGIGNNTPLVTLTPQLPIRSRPATSSSLSSSSSSSSTSHSSHHDNDSSASSFHSLIGTPLPSSDPLPSDSVVLSCTPTQTASLSLITAPHPPDTEDGVNHRSSTLSAPESLLSDAPPTLYVLNNTNRKRSPTPPLSGLPPFAPQRAPLQSSTTDSISDLVLRNRDTTTTLMDTPPQSSLNTPMTPLGDASRSPTSTSALSYYPAPYVTSESWSLHGAVRPYADAYHLNNPPAPLPRRRLVVIESEVGMGKTALLRLVLGAGMLPYYVTSASALVQHKYGLWAEIFLQILTREIARYQERKRLFGNGEDSDDEEEIEKTRIQAKEEGKEADSKGTEKEETKDIPIDEEKDKLTEINKITSNSSSSASSFSTTTSSTSRREQLLKEEEENEKRAISLANAELEMQTKQHAAKLEAAARMRRKILTKLFKTTYLDALNSPLPGNQAAPLSSSSSSLLSSSASFSAGNNGPSDILANTSTPQRTSTTTANISSSTPTPTSSSSQNKTPSIPLASSFFPSTSTTETPNSDPSSTPSHPVDIRSASSLPPRPPVTMPTLPRGSIPDPATLSSTLISMSSANTSSTSLLSPTPTLAFNPARPLPQMTGSSKPTRDLTGPNIYQINPAAKHFSYTLNADTIVPLLPALNDLVAELNFPPTPESMKLSPEARAAVMKVRQLFHELYTGVVVLIIVFI